MSAIADQPRSTKRERWAWYLYDFGNSAYAAVVLLAIYSTYFKEGVVGGAQGSALWGIAVGIAMLVVAVTSPVLGVVADYAASKKRFLFFYTAMACVFTAALFFVREGSVVIGMLFFILAEIGYRSAQVFYNALLPEIADPDEMAKVSGNGWAIGSAGGIVCLLIVLVLVQTIGGNLIVRLSMVITAIFFAASAAPIFLNVPERAKRRELPEGSSYLTLGFKMLWERLKKARSHGEFFKFLIAFLIYNDGILMALDFAAIIGAVLYGLDQEQLIIFMIIVQVFSVIGAYVFGLLADRRGGKVTVVVSLLLMIAAVVWLLFNQTLMGFFLIGSLAGFALTGVQSVSRTMVGIFSPPGQSAEFYGIFAVAGRTSSFIGPTIYGLIAREAAYRFMARGEPERMAEQSGQRIALLSVIVFLAVGLLVLLYVRENHERKGREVESA
jgi:UMF1 family MFS transporter